MRILSLFTAFIISFISFAMPAAGINTAYIDAPSDEVFTLLLFPPKDTHPRVLFTKKDLPTIQANMSNPENKYAKSVFDTHVNTYIDITDNYKADVLSKIESRALDYAVNGNSSSGKSAISYLNSFLSKSYDFKDKNDYSRYYGRIVNVIAEVYDWCYELLSSEQKDTLITHALNNAGSMEIGFPPSTSASFIGHDSEAQLLRDLLSFAIAVYDERPDIWDSVAGLFYSKYVPIRAYINKAGYHHQGTGYGLYRHSWDSYAYKLICAMGLPEPYSAEDLCSVSLGMMYMRRPDGAYIKDGDIAPGELPYSYRSNDSLAYLLDASISGNSYIKGEYYRQSLVYGDTGARLLFTDELTPSMHLILNRTDVSVKSNEELPLSTYMDTPVGMMLARSGWEDSIASEAVVAQMKVGEYHFGNHQHLDSGSFQIYYKGILATNGADYDRYGSENHRMYSQKSIASNTMLIYDPSEQNGDLISISNVNDGGQKYFDFDEALPPGANRKKAGVEAYEIDPDDIYKPEYTYIKGDITKAYSDKKLELFKRSFMFLNLNNEDVPAALIVFDKLKTTNEQYKKIWLMHSVERPEFSIEDNRLITTVKRSGKSGDGCYCGKMIIDTLLPEADNAQNAVYGGEGAWSLVNKYTYNTTTNSWDIADSVNYPALNQKNGSEAHCYRMELSPKRANTEDYFLNVIQLSDANVNNKLKVDMIDAEYFYGAAISDRVVMFSKTGERVADSFSIEAAKDGSIKYTVCDLECGIWSVNGSEYTVTSDGGILSFESSESEIKCEKISDTAKDSETGGSMPEKEVFYYIKDSTASFRKKTAEPLEIDGAVYLSLEDVASYRACTVEYTQSDEGVCATLYNGDKMVASLTENSNYILTDKGYIKSEAAALIKTDKAYMILVSEAQRALWLDIDIDNYSKIIFVTPEKEYSESVYYGHSNGNLDIFVSPKNAYDINYICALYSDNELSGVRLLTKSSGGIYRASLPLEDVNNIKLKLFRWAGYLEPLTRLTEPLIIIGTEDSYLKNDFSLTPDSGLVMSQSDYGIRLLSPKTEGDRVSRSKRALLSGGAYGSFGNTDNAEIVHYSICFKASKLSKEYASIELRAIREGKSHILLYYDKASGRLALRSRTGDSLSSIKFNIGEDYRVDVIIDINNKKGYLYIDGTLLGGELDYSDMENKLLSAAIYLNGYTDEDIAVDIKNAVYRNYKGNMAEHEALLDKVRKSVNAGAIVVN